MKKLLLIVLCLPMIFSSCKKEENCNCGDYIGDDYEAEKPFEDYAIKVRNDCTNNTETFIVDIDIYDYVINNDRYCTGTW